MLRTKESDPSFYEDKIDNGLPQGLLILKNKEVKCAIIFIQHYLSTLFSQVMKQRTLTMV